MKYTNILVILITSVSLISCNKYENGGLLASADVNLKNTWKLESYIWDGIESTNSLLIQNYIEEYQENGNYVRSYIDDDGENFSETGTWEFDSDKLNIRIMSVSSLELTDENSTVSSSDYEIIKLKKDELWYRYENGGNTHEFHFILVE